MSLLKKIDEISGSYKARNAWLTFAIVLFIAIIVIPAIFVVTKIFTEWDLVSGVLNDPASMDVIEGAVWNSFSIAFIVTVIDILVGLPRCAPHENPKCTESKGLCQGFQRTGK